MKLFRPIVAGAGLLLAGTVDAQQTSRTEPVTGLRDNSTGYHALVGARVVTERRAHLREHDVVEHRGAGHGGADYFVLDVPRDRVGEFTATVARHAPGSNLETVPTLRGAILAYGPKDNPTVVSEMEELPEGAWALRGERGLTYILVSHDLAVVAERRDEEPISLEEMKRRLHEDGLL